MNARALALGFASVLASALPRHASAQDFWGIDDLRRLYAIDTVLGSSALLGEVPGMTSPFSIPLGLDLAPDQTLYAGVPAPASPFTVSFVRIDPSPLSSSFFGGGASSILFSSGCAVDPSGASLWQIGPIGFAPMPVRLEQIDLASGRATHRGTFPGELNGLAFDAFGRLYSTTPGSPEPRLVRIDPANAANSAIVGPMTGMSGALVADLASDRGSGAITVLTFGSPQRVLAIDPESGGLTLLGTVSGVPGSTLVVLAAANQCAGTILSHGSGCAGSGGFVPRLGVTGCPAVANSITVAVREGLGGSTALLFAGLGQAVVPVGGSCSFLLSALVPAALSIPLSGAGAGNGGASFAAALPTATSGLSISLQAWVSDPAAPLGAAATRAVTLVVP